MVFLLFEPVVADAPLGAARAHGGRCRSSCSACTQPRSQPTRSSRDYQRWPSTS